nr:unnamed protein product [Spirometra erinaceieuropaei]
MDSFYFSSPRVCWMQGERCKDSCADFIPNDPTSLCVFNKLVKSKGPECGYRPSWDVVAANSELLQHNGFPSGTEARSALPSPYDTA